MLARLAHGVVRRRKTVIAVWFVLTVFGAFSAQRVSDRWSEHFSIPGYSAYETNQKVLRTFGNGAQPPLVAVFRSNGDVTKEPSIKAAIGESGGPSILTEALIGGVGALIILLFVFGTLPAVLMPLLVALASILNTFTVVWALTYLTDISLIVQFLIALIGLGVAIDYALLMIFRFREELAAGEDTETAIVETMTHAGRSVIVSGSTVAVGLLSMILLPLPFIRSIGIGGMLIPAVSVLVAITLLPALLSVLGPRINRVRVMPKRITHVGDAESGFWRRWGGLVVRRPIGVAAVGAAIVAILVVFGLQLNPS